MQGDEKKDELNGQLAEDRDREDKALYELGYLCFLLTAFFLGMLIVTLIRRNCG